MAGFSGNASTDAFGLHHNGAQFSTIDRDNDGLSSGNCAAERGGGFWWRDCGAGGCRVNGARSTDHFYWYDLSTVELVDDTYTTVDESWLFTARGSAVTL